MKRLFFLALLVSMATAAHGQQRVWLANDSSYATSDTSAWVNISQNRTYTLVFLSTDSCNLEIALDWRMGDTTTAATAVQQMGTWIAIDSTNITANLGGWKGVVVRDRDTDNLPGATIIRSRATRKTTRNGTTKVLYDLFLLPGSQDR